MGNKSRLVLRILITGYLIGHLQWQQRNVIVFQNFNSLFYNLIAREGITCQNPNNGWGKETNIKFVLQTKILS